TYVSRGAMAVEECAGTPWCTGRGAYGAVGFDRGTSGTRARVAAKGTRHGRGPFGRGSFSFFTCPERRPPLFVPPGIPGFSSEPPRSNRRTYSPRTHRKRHTA